MDEKTHGNVSLPEGELKRIYVDTKQIRLARKDQEPKATFVVVHDDKKYRCMMVNIHGDSRTMHTEKGLFQFGEGVGAPMSWIETDGEVTIDGIAEVTDNIPAV